MNNKQTKNAPADLSAGALPSRYAPQEQQPCSPPQGMRQLSGTGWPFLV